MLDFRLERFKKLPLQPGTIWQGGVFRLPAWVKDDDGRPFRPSVVLWVDVTNPRLSEPRAIKPDEDPHRAALDALIEFALGAEDHALRPMAIQVPSPELAAYLEAALPGTGTRVDCTATLPVLQELLDDLCAHLGGPDERPEALSGDDVSAAHMAAFATAAAGFYRARLWEELSDEDLIVIEQPAAPAGMSYVSVLGHAGQTFGLGFFESIKQYEKMHSASTPGRFFARNAVWSVAFGDITEVPFADAEIWEQHRLAVAGDQAYPVALRFGPKKKVRRPNAEELGFIEGLLNALASTTVDQMDLGRWAQTVVAGGRLVEYRLAPAAETEAPATGLNPRDVDFDPHLVRRVMEKHSANLGRILDEHDFRSVEEMNEFIQKNMDNPAVIPPRTALEQAQEIMYEAWEARGRRRRVLARKALETSPDCADAHVLLAEDSGNPQAALEHYHRGVEAGRRALGAEFFKEHTGHFWGLLETRPYMRAAAGRAQCLWDLGRQSEAVATYEELLRLNPGDNQGIRYLLGACLLSLGDNERLGRLLDVHGDEPTAQWRYLRALWVYRKEGDTPCARKLAKAALKTNRFVPGFLSGKRPLPEVPPPTFRMGHEDEAVCCATEQQGGWKATAGALQWLGQVAAGKS